MDIIVTSEIISEMIRKAIVYPEAITDLKDYVWGYYYGEDNYLFSPGLENVFIALSPYLEGQVVIKDELKLISTLKRCLYILENYGPNIDGLVGALYFDEINTLVHKYETNKIDDFTYFRKIKDLTPVDYNYKNVINFVRNIKV